MDEPQQFERAGKAYIGYAVAMRTMGGHEIIILAPTKDAAVLVGQDYGQVDPALVKRAALGPVPRICHGSEAKGGVA